MDLLQAPLPLGCFKSSDEGKFRNFVFIPFPLRSFVTGAAMDSAAVVKVHISPQRLKGFVVAFKLETLRHFTLHDAAAGFDVSIFFRCGNAGELQSFTPLMTQIGSLMSSTLATAKTSIKS